MKMIKPWNVKMHSGLVVLCALVALSVPTVFAGQNGSQNAQPFQALQDQIDALQAQIDGLNNRICIGGNHPADWQPYIGNVGVYVDVDTSHCGFTSVPIYTTALEGNDSNWATTGATSIYDATETGFRVYVRWFNGETLVPATAEAFNWAITFIAVGD
jgi:hypothetical protein